MDNGLTAALILTAIVIGMLGQGWVSLLDHQRRKQALDVIKTAIAAGREPPQQLYDLLAQANAPRAPWSEVVVFTALAIGFWLAFAFSDGDRRTAFLVVAATMTVTAVGCLGLAIFKPGRIGAARDDKR